MPLNTRTTFPVGEYIVSIEYDNKLGFVVSVKKKIGEATLTSRRIFKANDTETAAEEILKSLQISFETLKKWEEENIIKELPNPSFRRREHDRN